MTTKKILLLILIECIMGQIYSNDHIHSLRLNNHEQDLYVKTLVKNAQIYTKVMPKKTNSKYSSQYEQDKFVNEAFFKDKREGVFIDIGAHNGITLSNTYFFEKYLGWSGICVEPMADVFQELQKNRACLCINGCISNFTGPAKFLKITSPHLYTEMLSGLLDKYDPLHLIRIGRELEKLGGTVKIFDVQCYLLNNILGKHAISHVDYLSVDTEGGELDILKAIDFNLIDINIIDVENAYYDENMRAFLETRGYSFVKRIRCDEIYQKNYAPTHVEL